MNSIVIFLYYYLVLYTNTEPPTTCVILCYKLIVKSAKKNSIHVQVHCTANNNNKTKNIFLKKKKQFTLTESQTNMQIIIRLKISHRSSLLFDILILTPQMYLIIFFFQFFSPQKFGHLDPFAKRFARYWHSSHAQCLSSFRLPCWFYWHNNHRHCLHVLCSHIAPVTVWALQAEKGNCHLFFVYLCLCGSVGEHIFVYLFYARTCWMFTWYAQTLTRPNTTI